MKSVAPFEFESLLQQSTRWIDVRAPIEFQSGSIPGAINLPLLMDVERHEIGLAYKSQGQKAAIDLGHQLVSGPIREARVTAWLAEAKQHPNAVFYCFRGGLRSQIVQLWLKEKNVHPSIVEGGYKALRRYLMEKLDSVAQDLKFHVVSGPTGSGKTTYLQSSARPYLDLEALAKHRGSAFGSLSEPQPNQVDFENALAIALLRLYACKEAILIEDESLMIGHRLIPAALFRRMQTSRKIILDTPTEVRIENIFRDYVLNSNLGLRGDVGRFTEFRASVHAISRKLGGLRTQEILRDLDISQKEFESNNSLDSNRVWIRKLLAWYYDPSYKFSLQKNEGLF